MFRYGVFVVELCLLVPSAFSQTGDQRALLQQDLNSQFKLTRMTADRSDIVKAGSVVELQKDGLLMASASTIAPPTNTYKNGKVSMNFGAVMAWNMQLGGVNSNDVPQRKFVAEEKFWVTAFNIEEDGVVFTFYSDPYQDVRYYGKLKVPFQKHVMPPADEVMKTIAEVITVQADDDAAQSSPQQQPAKPAAPAPQQQAMKPIPPPPPPADAPPPPPKTITLGMTKDQVVAIFGQPQKVVNLKTKEIDYYPDMKVTFVKGKVTDVN